MKRMRDRSMGILIQERKSKRYYKGDGEWTSTRAKAQNFDSCKDAVGTIRREKLKADILLAFADEAQDINIPWE